MSALSFSQSLPRRLSIFSPRSIRPKNNEPVNQFPRQGSVIFSGLHRLARASSNVEYVDLCKIVFCRRAIIDKHSFRPRIWFREWSGKRGNVISVCREIIYGFSCAGEFGIARLKLDVVLLRLELYSRGKLAAVEESDMNANSKLKRKKKTHGFVYREINGTVSCFCANTWGWRTRLSGSGHYV